MSIAQSFLAEFDQEMANTRKMLELVPEENFEFAPHEKSMKLGRLAGHIAEMPNWGVPTVTATELDIHPVDGPAFEAFIPSTREEVLAAFDKNIASAKEAIAGASDEDLMVPWSLLAGGNVLFTMARIAVLKSMILNHIIHHRAQLGVYLRMNDVAIPGMYGPSADDAAAM